MHQGVIAFVLGLAEVLINVLQPTHTTNEYNDLQDIKQHCLSGDGAKEKLNEDCDSSESSVIIKLKTQ